MSFSADTKKEICDAEFGEMCCCTAECYGMLLFAHDFSENGIRIVTDHNCVAKRFKELCRVLFSFSPKNFSENKNNSRYDLRINSEDAERIFSFFGHDDTEISVRINNDIIFSPCCRKAFLRGAFLTGGSITDPYKEYHLEISTSYHNLASDVFDTIKSVGLSPKRTKRNGKNIIYFKSSEEIEDFLNTIGANMTAFDLMGIKLEKDLRNRANRVSNCDSYNISRSIETGIEQAEIIKRTIEKKGKGHIPQELRELAMLRVENPEASLKELGEMLEKPLSKSGVNHKLRRIMEYTINE